MCWMANLDIEQALASLERARGPRAPRTRPAASAEGDRAVATMVLGPVAATLTGRYAALTEDPFLVYRAVSTHIHVDQGARPFSWPRHPRGRSGGSSAAMRSAGVACSGSKRPMGAGVWSRRTPRSSSSRTNA